MRHQATVLLSALLAAGSLTCS
eukprot:COSAG03_NODE_12069_length_562_cov_10.574514_1_plen_21_part_10